MIEQIYLATSPELIAHEALSPGMRVYRDNLILTAARSLGITYPVISALLGPESIRYLARLLLQESPPSSGDWGDWGGPLAERLGSTPLASEYPFICDVARLEWNLHRVSRTRVSDTSLSTLSVLKKHPMETLRLQLSPALVWQHSPYPVDAIWQAHQPRESQFSIDQKSLAKAIREDTGQTFLLFYQENQMARVRRMTEQEFQWLRSISQGLSIGELIDQHPDVDVAGWFTNALQQNWITDVYPQDSSRGEL